MSDELSPPNFDWNVGVDSSRLAGTYFLGKKTLAI